MTRKLTILDAIQNGPPEKTAISAFAHPPLSYADLQKLTENVHHELNARGINIHDRVAIVLPNGPQMATAFLTVAANCATAPLNPSYRFEEFSNYLGDIKPKALLVEKNHNTPAREAARAQGIHILEITHSNSAPAGWFKIVSFPSNRYERREGQHPGPLDEALLLHTSGTTSKPKLVPLTQQNLIVSAQNIVKTLKLTREDVGLNIMPLFHIHGLVASLLSSIVAGARVECTQGFNAIKFFDWMQLVQPTWYTAVPTMHQAILSRAPRNLAIIEKLDLRFLRSSSASLSPATMSELENVFRAPVIEAYGMTEAAHQMASNSLPPKKRRSGTVGTATGPEIAIMNEHGETLPPGTTGEIVIRGANVFSGYENNNDANRVAFFGDWFRTGDEGVVDEQGFLTITGRLKEIINRGGEKIIPREVDEVLARHPAVQQVVTFALPHPKLGEDVAALVVLKNGAVATASDIKTFAQKTLSAFKVPRNIYFQDEIPQGATGKLQRIGLAKKLGLVE